MITGEIKSQVDKIWEAFWTGGVSNPLTVIEQFTYLLFIRRLDELQTLEESKANKMGIPMQKSYFSDEQQRFRWSRFQNMEPDAMFQLFTMAQPDAGNLTVFEHMKQLGASAGVFAQYMKGATFMIPTARLLDQVVQMVSLIKMDDRDTKGDLYEYLLSKIASAGTNGQFRTPRHIIKLMVDMVAPTGNDTICDPSCGTAGFLVAAGEYFQDQEPSPFHDKTFREHFNTKMFAGIEFDSTMLRIGAMNLQLHGIETPTLLGRDSLSEANAEIRDQYSLILANPPFKGSLDYEAVEKSLLSIVKTKKTELLFLALILRMLRTGGRAAVIVPDGVLFGSSNAHKGIRKEIVENHRLEAIISMPSGVFKPYAGVSTAIMFFTKTGTGGTDDVWFYDMKADGFSLDDKRNEIKESDLGDILARWKDVRDETATLREARSETGKEAEGSLSPAGGGSGVDEKQSGRGQKSEDRSQTGKEAIQNPPAVSANSVGEGDTGGEQSRPRTAQSFLVPKQEIVDNDYDLSINRYKEIVYEEIDYAAPAEIITEIKTLDARRAEALSMLEELLG